ncbi:hypothetical protein [Acaryochloris sp. IP29b_bin.148]|uniref:hypothetical protein n=1 Tax=Acaryochloris sp. IP29b_bin.148 TaxID=2969218 RepID=UPI0026321728|nr:hypothetical protein [Acaryochloris sp. IP29b_bin.148]
MSKQLSKINNDSSLLTELSLEEAESIQGGNLISSDQTDGLSPTINFSPELNVNASPKTNILIGVGGPALQINNGGDNNNNSGGAGVSFS